MILGALDLLVETQLHLLKYSNSCLKDFFNKLVCGIEVFGPIKGRCSRLLLTDSFIFQTIFLPWKRLPLKPSETNAMSISLQLSKVPGRNCQTKKACRISI